MKGRKECWVTAVLSKEDCLNALVLAKSLRSVLTSRPLVVLISNLVCEDAWELLQEEFDHCVRIRIDGTKAKELGDLFPKIHCWSLVEWKKIVYLDPICLVAKNCDEIFQNKEVACCGLDGLAVFVVEPSLEIWKKMIDSAKTSLDGTKNVSEIYQSGQDGFERSVKRSKLETDFIVTVNLTGGGLLTEKNLHEIRILKFGKTKPIEILCQTKMNNISGVLEKAVMELWKIHFEHGFTQGKLENVQFNGLEDLWQKYCAARAMQPLKITLDEYKNSIAIIGIACRMPEANNLDEFWKLLIEGKDAIRSCTDGRWNPEKCPKCPETAKRSKAGYLSCPIDEFDAKFFGMSPMELTFTDPQQRLLTQIAWEALEDAGLDPTALHQTYTGVFGGSWRTDYKELMAAAGIDDKEFLRRYLGNSFGVLTARISHCLGLTGPSITTESGCSSSMVAIDMACKSLLRGETDLALACGVNLILHPFIINSMSSVLAPDAHCKTFDAGADGFARAEGCGVFVLKRYADAVKDGDRVHALIRGSAVVQEGASRSLGTPTKYCEALAMKLALEEAGVDPKDVSYVETHGTGTAVGDPLEVAAVTEIYAECRETPLTIGSVKTNIGHTESVSGIAGIIKVILSMKNEVIPPHRNFETLNPAIDLDAIPAKIPMKPEEWKKHLNDKPRIAGVSSFGITGTDAHAIIQEAPDTSKHQTLSTVVKSGRYTRPCHILTLSARTPEALDQNLKQFKEFLSRTEERIEDIVYTANAGRGHFPFRTAIVGSTKTEILENMKTSFKKQGSEESPKICFLFTGQGSQYPGMAKDLYDCSPTFQMHFDHCNRILGMDYGINIKEVLWGKNLDKIGRTIYSQTSIFCVEYCLLKLWESWGIKPNFVLGHSLGEFAAAVGAGILKFEDALKLVAERSRLIDGLPGGKMLVLKQSPLTVEVHMKKVFRDPKNWLDYAAVNSPEQTVLAGSEENVKLFAEYCRNNGIKTHILDATHAFHSRHMDPILEEYRRVASTINYHKPTCTYISGMDGRIIDDHTLVQAEYWVRHTRDRVRFEDASKAVMNRGCKLFLEIGPQPVLSALTMINSDGIEGAETIACLPSIRKQESDWRTMLNTLGKIYLSGMKIDWHGFDQFSQVQKVSLPFYAFQNKSYWFEMPDKGPAEIHPIVGTPVPNASNIKLYTSKLDLDNAEFLRDHAIGSDIIFPGAGFMEMCLVSGHAATQCTDAGYFAPMAPITVENFTIESPLQLDAKKCTELQTIVTTEDSGDTQVTVYSKLILDKETQKWVRHASGKFSPYASDIISNSTQSGDNLEAIKARCKDQIETNEIYEDLADCGLKFGPTFRTIKKIYQNPSSDSAKEFLFEIFVTDNPENYICHPVVSDAMIQAVMISSNPNVKKLHVPVAINKFVWIKKIDFETYCYIHCQSNSSDPKTTNDVNITAVLYNSNGIPLALMAGASLMETSVSSIQSALEAQKLSLPDMYEDIWKSTLGPFERRANLEEFPSPTVMDALYVKQMEDRYNILSPEGQIFLQRSKYLCALYMIKGLFDLGWIPNVGETYEIKELLIRLKVLPGLEGFLRYILMELAAEGYFEITNRDRDHMSFVLVKEPSSMEQLLKEIENLHSELCFYSVVDIELVSILGRKLAVFLTGQESSLPYLFPEDPNSEVSAEAYYVNAKTVKPVTDLMDELSPELFSRVTPILQEMKGVLRILEVGAGTGSTTKTLLRHLEKIAPHCEYTYTDLSTAFFQRGKKIFENSKIKVHYGLLNIEEDPANQGFIPHHYDMVIASNVIHATKSITRTLGFLRNLLRDEGFILIAESSRPNRITNLVFGLLEAYWGFADFDLRPYNCEISGKQFEAVLKTQNFEKTVSFSTYQDHMSLIIAKADRSPKYICEASNKAQSSNKTKTWVIFLTNGEETGAYFSDKLIEMGNQVVIVEKNLLKFTKTDDFTYSIRADKEADMSELFKSIIIESQFTIKGVIFLWGLEKQSFESSGDYAHVVHPFLNLCKVSSSFEISKMYLVTKGVANIEDFEINHPLNNSPLLPMMNSYQNELSGTSCKCIDLALEEISNNTISEAFAELFINDKEVCVAYRENQRKLCRMIPWKPSNSSSALTLPTSGRFQLMLPSSRAVRDLRFGVMDKEKLKDNEIEIEVKAWALNFRDVFAVLKPSVEFENMNAVGIDYSGIVVGVGKNVVLKKVGDPVFGCRSNDDKNALPSHIVISEGLTMDIPSTMTFFEAATLPAVASTAYLSLLNVAELTSNDTILIHTASGGVGLVAIQIAKAVGATIVATAGNRRKRAYLKHLGIKYVFHSRNTEYGKEIRNALGGRGVDVVLNSLTSPGFKEASLHACNEGARFIEMSKLNTWTPQEVKILRPDVRYEIVDLSSATDDEMRDLMTKVDIFVKNSSIVPIPYVRFDVTEIREALTYLQKAKHIGKIVCAMPHSEKFDIKIGSGPSIPMFNSESTYLITGGLGGIGFEVAKWMSNSGAMHIVLVGRNPPNDLMANAIKSINSKGKNIIAMQCDIGNIQECTNLLDTIKSKQLPTLRGIMHAAGVLLDGTYPNQSWEKYEKTFNPKVAGGWNLHKLTLEYPLEHFVMFSSVASNGTPGQSNHASANYFLNALAYYRNSIGLAATTVKWGQWGQVGVAANKNLEFLGLRPFSILQGISALEKIMKSQKLEATVWEGDFNLFKMILPTAVRYVEELSFKKRQAIKEEVCVNQDKFWTDFDAASSKEAKLELLRACLRSATRQILMLDSGDVLNDNEHFQDLGMDSLMMIEMKNMVQSSLGNRLTVTVNSFKDAHTINELSDKLFELLSGEIEGEESGLTKEEIHKLIYTDSILPDHIKPVTQSYCKPSQIRSVLLTGATGTLGSYVLQELTNKSHIEKIYCLMRPGKVSPIEKLKKTLEEKSLLRETFMNKVVCITGSITKPKLGLSVEEYYDLSKETDAVVHLAVKKSFTDVYRNIKNGDNDPRNVNVKGTLNLLEFASAIKTKLFYHASDILINLTLDKSGKSMSEKWPEPDEFKELPNYAYPNSKFVCERLMAQAAERGLPVKVFRFPKIAGDSKTGGNISYDDNVLMLRLMTYLHLRSVPALPIPFFVIPVDICKDFSLKIFFDDNAPFDIYNVYNPFSQNEIDLVSIGKDLGYENMEVLEFSKFMELLDQGEESHTEFTKELFGQKYALKRLSTDTPAMVQCWVENPRTTFFSKKLAKILPEYPKGLEDALTIIKRDLEFAKNSGVLSTFGI